MKTTLHILWGREAVNRYRLGMLDNTVRLAHSVYDFLHPREAEAFLYGVGEAREPDDWMVVTNAIDARKLGMPLRSRLIDAAKRGDVDAVKELVQTGLNLAGKDEFGMTALHWASKNGHDKVAEVLLENGAPVDAPASNLRNETALHMACESNAPRAANVVELLVRYNASVEASDTVGNRPLHHLISGRDGNATSVQSKLNSLVAEGLADPRSENNAGQKPSDTAIGVMSGTAELFSLVVSYLDSVGKERDAAETRRADMMRGVMPKLRPDSASSSR